MFMAAAVLAQALQDLESCPSSAGVQTNGNVAAFYCSHSADSGYTVALTHFDTPAEAQAQFVAGRGANPLECFHGADLYRSVEVHPNNPYVYMEHLAWRSGPWLFTVSASYDYGYFHYTALGFADVVYAAGVTQGLFEAGVCPTPSPTAP
jgi:hypothetical protein